MRKTFLFLLVCAFWCGSAFATEPKIGAPAPDFTLTGLLQAPANAPTKLSGLRGNIVIIDFWATWCSPCRTAMNNLSALSEKYTDKPVRFLSISSEKREVIERYLKSNPNKLWMGIDGNNEAANQYEVRVIPHTVIVDKSGTLIAITDAEEITEERINALLAGKETTFKRRILLTARDIFEKEAKNIDTMALPSIVFKACQSLSGGTKGDKKRRFTAVSGISGLIQNIYQISHRQLIDSLQSEQLYYVGVFLPQSDSVLMHNILKNVVESGASLDVRVEKRTRPVALLQRKKGAQDLLPSSALQSEFSFSGPNLTAVKQPIMQLVGFLNNTGFAKVLVVDETGLKDRYDLSLSFVIGEKDGLSNALAKYGLELVNAEREIDMYIVKQKSR